MSIRNYVDALVKNEKERYALKKNNTAMICGNLKPEIQVHQGIKALAYGAGVKLQKAETHCFFYYDEVLFFQINEEVENETLQRKGIG